MTFNKRRFPHIYEYQKLGTKTPEGVKYREIHDKVLEEEYNVAIENNLKRQLFLTNKQIHLIDERNDL